MTDARSAVTLDLPGLQASWTCSGEGVHRPRPHRPQGRRGARARVTSVDDLPRGWGDTQEPGSYRLRRRDDEALFGYAADAISWKSVLFPSRELIWEGSRTPDGVLHRRRGGPSTAASATRRTPSSASGPATCTPSPSTTGCCETGPIPTCVTRPGARTPSSSRCPAQTPAGPASASPWAPVPAPTRATTSR